MLEAPLLNLLGRRHVHVWARSQEMWRVCSIQTHWAGSGEMEREKAQALARSRRRHSVNLLFYLRQGITAFTASGPNEEPGSKDRGRGSKESRGDIVVPRVLLSLHLSMTCYFIPFLNETLLLLVFSGVISQCCKSWVQSSLAANRRARRREREREREGGGEE